MIAINGKAIASENAILTKLIAAYLMYKLSVQVLAASLQPLTQWKVIRKYTNVLHI